MTGPTIAVLLPCYNEAAAIAQTVAGFRAALPGAAIYVYDNNSTDRTVEVAREAGAIVRRERIQGKGAVVRRMFADVDADIYVMADGDATYDAASAPTLIARLVDEQLDMIVGSRLSQGAESYRRGHRFGNALLTGMLARLFGRSFTDILFGLSRVLAAVREELPLAVGGVRDRDGDFCPCARTQDAVRGDRDALFSRGRKARSPSSAPMATAGASCRRSSRCIASSGRCCSSAASAAVLGIVALLLAVPLGITYMQTHLVPRFPTAILVTGLVIVAALCLFAGLILDTVVRGRREVRRLAYLAHPGARRERVSNPGLNCSAGAPMLAVPRA